MKLQKDQEDQLWGRSPTTTMEGPFGVPQAPTHSVSGPVGVHRAVTDRSDLERGVCLLRA